MVILEIFEKKCCIKLENITIFPKSVTILYFIKYKNKFKSYFINNYKIMRAFFKNLFSYKFYLNNL